ILLQGQDVTDAIRAEDIGTLASRIAALQPVRSALLERQRAFAQAPGLVADGRDMGTVIFPRAPLKIFLEADAFSRAKRRYKQLMDKGISANISHLTQDMQMRDSRDRTRANAPLVAAPDAHTIDSSGLTADETISKVLALWAQTRHGNSPQS
ncbi:MAG TPA: (d)CMP kinase, partial [Burkholderiaceae bacterium]|nr:(d)CMP kinase [Burkholderiaceae bacterium]